MTWHEMVVQTQADISKKVPREVVRNALSHLFASIAENALHGRRVMVPGFGVFSHRRRKSRRVLNPVTGQPIQLPATLSVGFRCSKSIKR